VTKIKKRKKRFYIYGLRRRARTLDAFVVWYMSPTCPLSWGRLRGISGPHLKHGSLAFHGPIPETAPRSDQPCSCVYWNECGLCRPNRLRLKRSCLIATYYNGYCSTAYWWAYIHSEAERRNRFLWINLLIRIVIWENLVPLLLMNIIIDVTFLICGIYTNFRRLLCKKCDYDITSLKHDVMKLIIPG